MKKYIYNTIICLIFIFSFLFSSNVKAFAADQTIKLELGSETQNSQTGKFAWVLKITTTNIPDGAIIKTGLAENSTKEMNPEEKQVTIKNNYTEFHTDSILTPSTKYLVTTILLDNPKVNQKFSKTTPEGIKPDVITNGEAITSIGSNVIDNSPVGGELPVSVTPKQINLDANNDTTYKFLAPIGLIKSMKSNCKDTDPTCMGNNIGKYLNYIFKFIIGLCAALAVIMLIINGVMYMGDESIFGKTEAKSKMFAAIGGLLIALGAYALLNTINPDLTGKGGVTITPATIELEETPIETDNGKSIPTKNSFINCAGGTGLYQINGESIIFCKAYVSKLQDMILAAKNAGYILTGGGFREYEEQVALRNKYCPDPKLTVPSSSCKPQVAIPGRSTHEQGLARDFHCNGELINWDKQNPRYTQTPKTKACFDWLVQNAGTYGFANLPKENWHWSTGPDKGR